ncbi:hypothetical protein NDU88_002741 [Pleurodeles waltl]|uniref:Uncharacterized protein n=1 Tax=Pleurodeles waltl TaxID=8319 RepID=A0AAV7WR42_PLEWA|nr:hypothetical protein NDU88_002741 [Pleurodeles waltl]
MLYPVSIAAYDDQGGDEYYVDDPAGSFEQDLVYALDAGVSHAVNQALAQAIRPIKCHLIGFAEQKGWVAPSWSQTIEDPSLSSGLQALKQGKHPHAAYFKSLIRSLARDQDLMLLPSQSLSPRRIWSLPCRSVPQTKGMTPQKRLKKSHHQEEPIPALKILTFEPEDIVHPWPTLWLPPVEVADYAESHIRHGFEEVCSKLHSECRRPDFPSKVTETLELDPTLATYLKTFSKDLKKGIDRAWRGCQDKLLDMTGPLTKILEMGFQAKDSGDSIDPDILVGWAQRALCFLGKEDK